MSINELFQDLKKSNEERAKSNAETRTKLNDLLAMSTELNESLERWGARLKKDRELLDRMEETLAKRKQFCGSANSSWLEIDWVRNLNSR